MGQLLVNGIVSGAIIAPPAIAFTLMIAILKFPNFAIGAYITIGAFATLVFDTYLGLHIVPSVILGMMLTALCVWSSDLIVFRHMRGFRPVTLLVVSIAVSLIIENIVRLMFGNDVRGFDIPLTRPIKTMGIKITVEQIWIVAVALGAMLAVHLLLRYTALGKAMRATADNFALAEVRGINTARVIAATWLIGGLLAGLAGALAGLDLVIEPLLGWNLTIPVLAAAILGGIGSPYGAMLGAVLVGIAEEITALAISPTYKVGVGFVIIGVILLLRPQGLLGQPEIKK